MSKFIPPTDAEIKKYECEAPHYLPVMHTKRTTYEKCGDAFYRLTETGTSDEVKILCTGDILCEEKLYNAHNYNGRFNFHDIFSFIRPLLQDADLTIGNLETTICSSSPYTGEQYKIDGKYHCNAPIEFLDAISQAGYDFLMLANNHNLDSGYLGVLETLHHIDERGFMHTGLFSSTEEKRFSIIEARNIRIGLLSYSTWYNRNLYRFTELGQQLLNEYSREKVSKDVEAARAAGAEFILVYIHWGIDAEYSSVPSKSMLQIAEELAECGVDYIVGSHTHSLQPYKTIVSSSGKEVPCLFSLGNFVTSEISPISRETGVLEIHLKKDGKEIRIAKERFIPCYIPNLAYSIGFPIIPEGCFADDKTVKEKLKSAYHHSKNIVNIETEDTILSKKFICDILQLPTPNESDTRYTGITFAVDSIKGSVSIISNITSNPLYRTPEADFEKLAKIAMEKGAKLLLSPKPIGNYPVLVVEDPFDAYCRIVTAIRKRFSPKTISVTGSIGKTTASEMVYSVVSSRYNTHRNTGSANNVRYAGGVIQKLKPEHEIYVQETMEGPPFGAASTIAKMVQPQVAIITVIGTSHMEAFGSQERILESCLGIQDGMPENGLLILNADDSLQWDIQPKSSRKILYYGIQNIKADYRAVNISAKEQTLCFDILHSGKSTSVQIHCFGKHNILNALAAFAAGEWAGMSDSEIVTGLEKYRTSGIRQNLVKYGGFRLFLDCYNSAPESVQSALDALSTIPVPARGRKIAVLADIKEVGEKEKETHQQIGRIVVKSCIDMLIVYGESSRITAEVVRAESEILVYHTNDPRQLADYLKEIVTEDDLTLFKGSHTMALEAIVDKVWGTWFHEEFERYDLKTRIVSDGNLRYQIYTDHATVINKVSNVTDVLITDFIEGLPVTGIGRSAFNQSKYMRSVVLPNNLANIRYCAFYKTNGIQQIHIPASVRIIDTSAFSTCENLTEVTIEEGCIHIGFRAFGNCKRLQSIMIPASVKQIENEAFLNCTKLTIYGVPGSYAETYAQNHKIPFVSAGGARLCFNKRHPVVDENISCVLMDADSGDILFEQKGTERTMIASLAKMMIAYRQIKLIETGMTSWKWDSVYTVQDEVTFPYLAGTSRNSNSTIRGERDKVTQYLVPGEQLTMESLLYGAMVLSGNDAASAIAVALDGSEERYLKTINTEMHALPFDLSEQTQFGRAYGRECYSTAIDVAKMMRVNLVDKDIAPIFWTVCGAADTTGRVYIKQTNGEIEGVERAHTHQFISGAYRSHLESTVKGPIKICGKTGTFGNRFLATAVQSGNRTLIATVLCAKTSRIRDDSTLALLSWGFNR